MREEDTALCRAWMRASENPLKGAQQRSEDFWKSVYEFFASYGPKGQVVEGTWSARNINALRHRWATISRDVMKFCGIYQRVVAAKPSGKNEDDLLKDALEVFEGVEGSVSSGCLERQKASKFLFLDCWKVLRLSPRWSGQNSKGNIAGVEGKRKREVDNGELEESLLDEIDELNRKSGISVRTGSSILEPRGGGRPNVTCDECTRLADPLNQP